MYGFGGLFAAFNARILFPVIVILTGIDAAVADKVRKGCDKDDWDAFVEAIERAGERRADTVRANVLYAGKAASILRDQLDERMNDMMDTAHKNKRCSREFSDCSDSCDPIVRKLLLGLKAACGHLLTKCSKNGVRARIKSAVQTLQAELNDFVLLTKALSSNLRKTINRRAVDEKEERYSQQLSSGAALTSNDLGEYQKAAASSLLESLREVEAWETKGGHGKKGNLAGYNPRSDPGTKLVKSLFLHFDSVLPLRPSTILSLGEKSIVFGTFVDGKFKKSIEAGTIVSAAQAQNLVAAVRVCGEKNRQTLDVRHHILPDPLGVVQGRSEIVVSDSIIITRVMSARSRYVSRLADYKYDKVFPSLNMLSRGTTCLFFLKKDAARQMTAVTPQTILSWRRNFLGNAMLSSQGMRRSLLTALVSAAADKFKTSEEFGQEVDRIAHEGGTSKEMLIRHYVGNKSDTTAVPRILERSETNEAVVASADDDESFLQREVRHSAAQSSDEIDFSNEYEDSMGVSDKESSDSVFERIIFGQGHASHDKRDDDDRLDRDIATSRKRPRRRRSQSTGSSASSNVASLSEDSYGSISDSSTSSKEKRKRSSKKKRKAEKKKKKKKKSKKKSKK